MTVVQAYLCSHHYKGGRSELPKNHELPRQVGSLVTQGISVNSSYSSDVRVSGNMVICSSSAAEYFSQVNLGFVLTLLTTTTAFD